MLQTIDSKWRQQIFIIEETILFHSLNSIALGVL